MYNQRFVVNLDLLCLLHLFQFEPISVTGACLVLELCSGRTQTVPVVSGQQARSRIGRNSRGPGTSLWYSLCPFLLIISCLKYSLALGNITKPLCAFSSLHEERGRQNKKGQESSQRLGREYEIVVSSRFCVRDYCTWYGVFFSVILAPVFQVETEYVRLTDELALKKQTEENGDIYNFVKLQADQGVTSAQVGVHQRNKGVVSQKHLTRAKVGQTPQNQKRFQQFLRCSSFYGVPQILL